MNYILDIAVVAAIVFFTWRCYRKGFIKTAVLLFGFVIAAILARAISTPVSVFTYDNLIKPSVVETLEEKTEEISGSIAEKTDALLDGIPAVFKNATKIFGETDASETVEEKMNEEGKSIATTLEENVIAPAAKSVIQIILFIVLFFVLAFLIKRLAFLANIFNKLPLVGKVNRLLGAAAGLLEGIVIVFVATSVIYILMFLIGEKFPITNEMINESLLFKFFFEKNPLMM